MTVAVAYDPVNFEIRIKGSSKDDLEKAYINALTGSEIKTHLALLIHANRHGRCWPGLKTLERITGLTRKTVLAGIAGLVAKVGLITTARKGQSTLYLLRGVEKFHPKYSSIYTIKKFDMLTTKDLGCKNSTPPVPDEWKRVQSTLEKLFKKQPKQGRQVLSELVDSDLIPEKARLWLEYYQDKRDSKTARGLGWLVSMIHRAIRGEVELPDEYPINELNLPMADQLKLRARYAMPADYVGHLGVTS